ncbi:MAG: 30S ribosomal protein S6 [Armatimonadetes bacterium]|nr:30S ribosomal protein S6 [Armatimonadota bacterium]
MPVRLYEAMYIVRPEVTDEDLRALMGRVADTVGQIGGTIELHDVWERREMAYAIDGCKRGTYVICYFNADSGSIDALRKELELEEQVLRHVVVVPNPRAIWRPMSAEPAPAPDADAEKAAGEEAPTEDAVEEVGAEPEEAKEEEEAPTEAPVEEADAGAEEADDEGADDDAEV